MVVHAPLGRAVLAGLLVLVGLGSVVATDQASTEPMLAVPAVHVGDRGEYAGSIEYRDGTPTGPRAGHWTGQTFVWHDGAVRTDEDGVSHAVRVLETYTNATPGAGWSDSWALWSLDAETGATVAVDNRWHSGGYSSVVSTPGRWTTVGNTTTFGSGGALCGMRSSLLGTSGPPPEKAWMDGACSDEAGLGPDGRTEFRLEGKELVGGFPAYRYAPMGGGSVRVWFASGIAAPLQVVQPSVAGEAVRDVLLRLRLTGWEPGSSAETMRIVTPGQPAPPLQLAPRDRWLGPELGDLHHPFPHTAAWDVALGDSRSTLASYIGSHEDAYLMLLYGYRGTNGLEPVLTWNFLVTDGRSALGVYVSQVDPRLPAFLPDAVRFDVGTYDPGISPLWLPDPDEVPDLPFPTVGSVADRWELLRGRDLPDLSVYGFATWCLDSGCREVRSWSFVGEATTALELNTTSLSGTWDTLTVDLPSGSSVMSHEDSESVTQLGVGTFRPLPPLDSARLGAAPPAGPATLATQWIASPAGAGTFMAALLVAILTYFWPTIKQGALGLFSRLTPETIAAHPARQAILDAIDGSPGIHFQALCRTVGKGRGVVGHHLAKLVAAGQVTQHRKGGFTCYFLKGQDHSGAVVAAVTALKADGAQRLLHELVLSPDLSGLELAEATGLSPSTVHYHLRRLQDAGLVAASPRGRSLSMRLTPSGKRAAQGVVA